MNDCYGGIQGHCALLVVYHTGKLSTSHRKPRKLCVTHVCKEQGHLGH